MFEEHYILENARIWTGSGCALTPSRIEIRESQIHSLDPEQVSPGTPRVDVEGAYLVPGFIDAHLHLLFGGQSLLDLDLSGVESREAFEQAIADRHRELPPGQWLIAGGWSVEGWPGQEQPDRSWLSVAGDRPVACFRRDLHQALVNDVVLDLLEIEDDPPGGRVCRRGGEPTGLLLEAAVWHRLNPIIPQRTQVEKTLALHAAEAVLLAAGVTTVASMEYRRDIEEVYLPARDHLDLRVALVILDREMPLDIAAAGAFPGDDRVWILGCKSFIDGTFGSRTARMLDAYEDAPGDRGMLLEHALEGSLADWVSAVAGAGLQPVFHAIGDEAVRMALDVSQSLDSSIRPRIEHAQCIAPRDVERFAGRIASMQPLHRVDDGMIARARLGTGRLDRFYPYRSLLRAGAELAFGSDWPVVSCSPLQGIQAAVTSMLSDGSVFMPGESLTVEEALHAYTHGAAHALRRDDLGRLEPGYPADIVALDADPFAWDWTRGVPGIQWTCVAGKRVVPSDVPVMEQAQRREC